MSYTHDGRRDEPRQAPPAQPRAGGQLDRKLEAAAHRVAIIRGWFYAVVLLVALGGQISGAMQALGLAWYFAVPAVTALELGGVVVMANADVRRRLGERAVASRLLSAAIAGGAVAFNWLSHADKKAGGFFAGMSLLGYLVWLMHTENSRRDRLRATGDLPPTTPAYEPVGHWLRHPWVTRRALALAKASPGLGLYPSLRAARAEIRAERRHGALSTVLHRKIRKALDKDTADIAVAVYDLDEIAHRLADRADYDGLTALIAADLTPARVLAGNQPAGTGRRRWWRRRAGVDQAALASAQRLIAEVLADTSAASSASAAQPATGEQAAIGASPDRVPALPAGGKPAGHDPQTAGSAAADSVVRAPATAEAPVTSATDDAAVPAAPALAPLAPVTAPSRAAVARRDAPSRSRSDWERVQRELEELLPAAVNRRAEGESANRGRGLPDLVRTAVDRTSSATDRTASTMDRASSAVAAAAPVEVPSVMPGEVPGQHGEVPRQRGELATGSLKARVFAALDHLVPAGDTRDNATLTGLVVDHLDVEASARGTVGKYVRGWRAEVADGRREPAAGRRLRAVPPSS